MDNHDKRKWVIDVTTPCQRRGIENPYQLWKRIGGSKQTTALLFSGDSSMIRLDTINKLYEELGILPTEIFSLEESN